LTAPCTGEQNPGQRKPYFRLEERFTSFERTLGLALPKTWSVRCEASGRTTVEWKYELSVQAVEPK
jgi:hypothetical protein